MATIYYEVGTGTVGGAVQFGSIAEAISAVPNPPSNVFLPDNYVILLTSSFWETFNNTLFVGGNRKFHIQGIPLDSSATKSTFVRFGLHGATGPMFRVGDAAHVTFWDVGFNLWSVNQQFQPTISSDGEPGGAAEAGAAIQVDGNATVVLNDCCDILGGSPGRTVHSALGVYRETRPRLEVRGHRSFVVNEPGIPAVTSAATGTTFLVSYGELEIDDSVLPVLPRAVTSVSESAVQIRTTLFEPTPEEFIPAGGNEAREAILHRASPDFTAPQEAYIDVTDCMFVECLNGIEVRGLEGTVPGNSVTSTRVERCMFAGFDEETPENSKSGPEVWGHLVGIKWRFTDTDRGSRTLVVENNIFRGMAEALQVSAWWWSTITMQNNTVVNPRFACVFLDNPNEPATDNNGNNAETLKNVWITNNLFQSGAYPAFDDLAPAGADFTGKYGILFLGPNTSTWDVPTGAFGRLKIATNYFANFELARRVADLLSNIALPSYLPVAGPTVNPTSSPPNSALVEPPRPGSTVVRYDPRLGLVPPARNASDTTFTIPPSIDFFAATRWGAADLGAVEAPYFGPAPPLT